MAKDGKSGGDPAGAVACGVHVEKDTMAPPKAWAPSWFMAKQKPAAHRRDTSLPMALARGSSPTRKVADFLLPCIEVADRFHAPQMRCKLSTPLKPDSDAPVEAARLKDALATGRRKRAPLPKWSRQLLHLDAALFETLFVQPLPPNPSWLRIRRKNVRYIGGERGKSTKHLRTATVASIRHCEGNLP
jgi:hypothetical protein